MLLFESDDTLPELPPEIARAGLFVGCEEASFCFENIQFTNLGSRVVYRDPGIPSIARTAPPVTPQPAALPAMAPDAAAAPAQPQPLPGLAEREQALEALKESHIFSLRGQRTPQDKLEFVRLLLETAPGATGAVQYAHYELAYITAMEVGEIRSISEVLEAWWQRFELDRPQQLAETLDTLFAAATNTQAREAFVHGTLVAASAFLDRADLEVARVAHAAVDPLMGKLRNAPLRDTYKAQAEELAALVAILPEVEAARAVLANNPQDAAANLTLGKYLCLYLDDWRSGIEHLIRSDDNVYAALARGEQAAASSPLPQWPLAEAWLQLAQRATGIERTVAADRARRWLHTSSLYASEPERANYSRQVQEVERIRKVSSSAFAAVHSPDALFVQGRWYQRFDEERSWSDAYLRCVDMGGMLLCLETPAEYQAVVERFVDANPRDRCVWLGASRAADGSFRWITGPVAHTAVWATGYPRAAQTDVRVCMEIDRFFGPTTTKWYNTVDDKPAVLGDVHFICEWDR